MNTLYEILPGDPSILVMSRPYQLVGDFLTLEGRTSYTWPFTVLLPAIEDVRSGKRSDFSYGGDAFMVEVTAVQATVSLVVFEPSEWESCVIPLQEFYDTLAAWCEFVKVKNG